MTASARLGRDDVQVFTDGSAATNALLAAVNSASRSVDTEIYEFDRAELVEAVLAATRRGVAVRMIGDPTVRVTVKTGRRLAAGGALVTFFPVAAAQIDHVKLLIVDGAVAYFGGVNWGAGSFRNRDYELRVVGPGARHLEHLFAKDLQRAGTMVPAVPDAPSEGPEPRFLTSFPDDAIGRAVVASLRQARHSIELEMFVMTDADTIRALQDAARRGVAVQVLFDPGQDLNQAAMVRLREAGVACRFFLSSGEKLHAKTAVIDGDELIIGSANWTASGFRHNHELDAVLRSRLLAAAVAARMDADWAAAA
ncbi:MAG TPA: phosphatidylserine/phosphatidylglycerophosphate/cardiolipin synthase family protein [Candidatus Dormibacteraeota bacterium]|nr:phosphatidylserine/phosphatidylglycerophosphate/cardiolipin synthase family protein [Candidatus Dormibacteraeota bacterium]